MALLDEIRLHCESALQMLDSTHDFYSHSKSAWRLSQTLVERGHAISFQNLLTNHTIEGEEIPRLAQNYISGYLATATFQQFVSHFETFIFGFIGSWLNQYPQSLAKKTVEFNEVIQSSDRSEIIDKVVQKELIDLAYGGVRNWFTYLEKLVNLNAVSDGDITTITEIKASRDVLVHNNGIVNTIYQQKSGENARFQVGDSMEIPESYHRSSWESLKSTIQKLSQAAIDKLTD
ncbi:MAG: hypothetical protein HUJ26_04050 [Planctomycetaceae bacterium]|nr:hypothetical protein [Planctomycetaceae bacterium]